MRCLRALGEWDRLAHLSSDLWHKREQDPKTRRVIAPMAAAAAWHLGRWNTMPQYLSSMEENRPEAEFFAAIHAVHQNEFKEARKRIDKTRELLDPELTAFVGESYNRAYRVIVQVQQIAELEEVMTYKECDNSEQQALIRKMWAARLNGCQRNVDVWQQILAVRSLVVGPKEDIPTWLKFAALCRKSGRLALSLKVLSSLMDPNATGGVSSVFDMKRRVDPDIELPLPEALPQVVRSVYRCECSCVSTFPNVICVICLEFCILQAFVGNRSAGTGGIEIIIAFIHTRHRSGFVNGFTQRSGSTLYISE
jgi:hypothetical protein